jgi:hypothetical protein
MSSRVFALCVAVGLTAGGSAALAQSSTVRIEPRPVYGATVSLEEGVRVFRPIPPDKHVIVNPNGTPVNLNLSETNVTETRRSFSRSENNHRYYGNPWNNGWGSYRPCIPAIGDRC